MSRIFLACLLASVVAATTADVFIWAEDFASHPAMRPLDSASNRPLSDQRPRFVDGRKGDDANAGTREAPWRSLQHAVNQLEPGDVLYLREGVYREHVVVRSAGTERAPITIRSYPGELAVLDGGIPLFAEDSAQAWEPVANAPLEFRSVRSFPDLERVAGNFGDSLLPLHSYRRAVDLRSLLEAPDPSPSGNETRPSLYVGPGLWYDAETERIHARLAPTHIRSFGPNNYQGETDPRKLTLIIASWKSTPLTLENAQHVHIQDLAIRGGGDSTLLIRGCRHIQLDGLTVYAANRGIRVETTGHLRLVHSAIRGPSPPWGSRTASKYYAADSHLFVPVGTYKIEREERQYLSPQCHDFEIAHCEFTDGHDGVYVGGVQRLSFHHNYLDNMNDDGIYLSAWGPPGSDVKISQNYLSRCLTTFAFGLGRGSESDPGDGTFIFRNVVDLRQPVPYSHPLPDAPRLTSYGRLAGDHGGPIWEPLYFYHNTVLTRQPAFRGYYAAGWGGHMRNTQRRVFNNIFLQTAGLPGFIFESPAMDFQAGGNLFWSQEEGPGHDGDVPSLVRFRTSPAFEASKVQQPDGWTNKDRFADPSFPTKDSLETPANIALRKASPAVDLGIPLPNDWPDPYRTQDAGPPDAGARPLDSKRIPIGPRHRLAF